MDKKSYTVAVPFLGNSAEGMVRPGDTLELEPERARELLQKGLIDDPDAPTSDLEPADPGAPGPKGKKVVTPPETK